MIVITILLYPRIFLTKEAAVLRMAEDEYLEKKGRQPSGTPYFFVGFCQVLSGPDWCESVLKKKKEGEEQ
jgi:hypothetical protein